MARKNSEVKVKFVAETQDINNGLKSTQNEIKVLNSRLSLNAEKLKGASGDTNLLSERTNLLSDALAETQKKTELMNVKLQKAKELFGEDSKEVKDLESALNYNMRSEQKLQNEIDKCNAELNKQSDVTEDVCDSTEATGEALADFTESMDSAGAKSVEFGDLLKANLASDLIRTGVEKLTDAVGSFAEKAVSGQKALNNFQGKTGMAADKMQEFEDIMYNVYMDNFGEGLEDIADVMATIHQQTGQTGDELQNTTERAILLRDTFGWEVSESVRAANSMMNQFGISSEEAFDLMVQGAQKGLDQNDDLLDTINEYSVQFKDAGYSAQDMFNMLANGAENLIVPPYMPDMFKTITSVPNNKTTVMTYEEIMTAWENLRQKYPNYITRTLLGKDTSGTLDMYRYDFKPEIVLLSGSVQSGMNKIYTKDDYPIVIMDACIHGAERPCAKALLNLMELIADAKDYSILGWMRNNIHFVIVPIANPWGYKNNSRTNVNHVDINRNFEPLWEHGSSDSTDDRFRGTSPLSEKESQYIDAVLSECSEKAVCYYSFHTHGLFTGYNAMTNFSSPALFMLNEMQNVGMSVTKMITASGWTNHNLPQDSGYIGQMEMAYSAMASYQGALHGIPSACPEVMYRYYDGGTGEIYNTDLDCMNTEYILYSVANACKKFLYGN